jgi:hypothetical protein
MPKPDGAAYELLGDQIMLQCIHLSLDPLFAGPVHRVLWTPESDYPGVRILVLLFCVPCLDGLNGAINHVLGRMAA